MLRGLVRDADQVRSHPFGAKALQHLVLCLVMLESVMCVRLPFFSVSPSTGDPRVHYNLLMCMVLAGP